VSFLGKLVRDRIPEIIRAGGQLPVIRTADPAEYRGLLREKLAEESGEFLASTAGDPGELANVVEVVRALADDLGVTQANLEGAARRRGPSAAVSRSGSCGVTGLRALTLRQPWAWAVGRRIEYAFPYWGRGRT
jgi:predicted house-cleaning noncanonical NTP pyrophosphatase (MazG superfamily)